ncbi:MAG: DUF2793 domain-containing protein [Hyphomicrobiales bacterium]
MSDPTATARLGLPLIQPAEAQKHISHNEAIVALDTAAQLSVLARGLAEPPAEPEVGNAWIVAGGGTGDWAGNDGKVAVLEETGWRFHAARAGWRAWVSDEARLVVFDGAVWHPFEEGAALQQLDRLGIGTTADAGNPFSARLDNMLVTARSAGDGGSGDIRVKLNKEATGNTATFLFQSGWSGRAEIGLAGADVFSLKTSADGASWASALIADGAGRIRQPQRPLFMGQRLAGTIAASGVFVADSVLVDIGGAYQSATGAYTCPVEGVYELAAGGVLDTATPAAGTVALSLWRNGAQVGADFAFGRQNTASGSASFSGRMMVAAAAGDVLECRIACGAGGRFYGTGRNWLSVRHLG